MRPDLFLSPVPRPTLNVGLGQETEVHNPLPGGLGAMVRFFFNVPQWVQIGGLVLGVILAGVVVVTLWRHRYAIRDWIVYRPAAQKIGLAIGAAVLALSLVGFGVASWNYVQHANEFCQGCHVMTPAFQRFGTSEHADLGCHECHRQSIFASMRQLYLWVAERPGEIGPHAKVPTEICAECHIRDDPDTTWQRISATAGHRLHLASTDPALTDVECVTCHGVEVHRFVPVDATCGQSGCHEGLEIQLGDLGGQTSLHCVTCHAFIRPLEEEDVPTDTARLALLPGEADCFACHEVEERLAGFESSLDPHGARCGLCHNPHEQATPSEAFGSCTEAGCHERPEEITPFHRGLSESISAECSECHEAHEWVVDGTNCQACHPAGGQLPDPSVPSPHPTTLGPAGPHPGERVPAGGIQLTEPARGSVHPDLLDRALRLVSGSVPPQRYGARQAVASQQRVQGFDHEVHAEVQCTACHDTTAAHGTPVVRTPADCMACHHSPRAGAECTDCHSRPEIAGGRELAVRMGLEVWPTPRERSLPFDHARHHELECSECHTGGLQLTAARECFACHEEHHAADRNCMGCHAEPAADAHDLAVHIGGCGGSGCHEQRPYERLEPTRSLCLACHQEQVDHQVGGDCAACHAVSMEERLGGRSRSTAGAEPGRRGGG